MSVRTGLRSQVSQEDKDKAKLQKQLAEEKKRAKENRPYLQYHGKTVYATNFIDCAIACDSLLQLANKCTDDEFVVGFDMEWPFNFQTGSGKTALIQISPSLDICYLLHLPQIEKLPKGLPEFLQHPKVKLTGVNIKNDVRKLARDYPGFNVDLLIDSCIDVRGLANSILQCRQTWSMEKLVDYVLDLKINKDKKVRMSKWHVVPLTEEQCTYAATDGYASLRLYFELKKMEKAPKDLSDPLGSF